MIRRRSFVRTVSFLLAAVTALTAAACEASKAESEHGEALEKIRLSGLVSLCEYSSQLSAGLRALAVAADGITAEPAAYVASRAVGAKGCAVCFDDTATENTVAFFDGVYEFAQTFPAVPDENLRLTAIRLSDYAQELYYHLSDISNAVMNGEMALSRGEAAEFFENSLDFTNGTESELFFDTADTAESTQTVSAKITQEAAKEAASALFGINSALWRGGDIKNDGETEVFCLEYDDISVEVAAESGKIAAFTVVRTCSAAQIDADTASTAAADFVSSLGFPEMRETARNEREFRTEIELAPYTDGILYLNSPVRVAVCRCTGKIIRFDCTEYIENYRKIEAVNASADLTSLIPQGFTLAEQTLCVENILGRARLCFLAECEFHGEEARLFFDYFSLEPLKSEPC